MTTNDTTSTDSTDDRRPTIAEVADLLRRLPPRSQPDTTQWAADKAALLARIEATRVTG